MYQKYLKSLDTLAFNARISKTSECNVSCNSTTYLLSITILLHFIFGMGTYNYILRKIPVYLYFVW